MTCVSPPHLGPGTQQVPRKICCQRESLEFLTHTCWPPGASSQWPRKARNGESEACGPSIFPTVTRRKKLRKSATCDHQSPQAAPQDEGDGGNLSQIVLSSPPVLLPEPQHEARGMTSTLWPPWTWGFSCRMSRENGRFSLSEHLPGLTEPAWRRPVRLQTDPQPRPFCLRGCSGGGV